MQQLQRNTIYINCTNCIVDEKLNSFTIFNARHIAPTAASQVVGLDLQKSPAIVQRTENAPKLCIGCFNILSTIVVLEPELKYLCCLLLKFSQCFAQNPFTRGLFNQNPNQWQSQEETFLSVDKCVGGIVL